MRSERRELIGHITEERGEAVVGVRAGAAHGGGSVIRPGQSRKSTTDPSKP